MYAYYIRLCNFGINIVAHIIYIMCSSLRKGGVYLFPEISSISPSEGSVAGGTRLTVRGRYFDITDDAAHVYIAGPFAALNFTNPPKLLLTVT